MPFIIIHPQYCNWMWTKLVVCITATNFYIGRCRLKATEYVDTRHVTGNSDESMASLIRDFPRVDRRNQTGLCSAQKFFEA